MKTAYELAMERLGKMAPTVKLSAGQKKRMAELDSQFAAKVAGREIALRGEIDQAAAAGDSDKVEKLQQQLSGDRKKLQAELEEKKEQVRRASTK